MSTATLQLHDYQQVAKAFLQANPRSALFLDMGLGKTAATLSALTPDHLPALVIAPKRVADNVWDEEVERWRPDLTIAKATGSPAQRQQALASGADIVVMGRDVLGDALPHRKRFRTLVLDELSGFKNRSTSRWKAARQLAVVIPHVWGLTGTPSPNGLLDVWAPMYLLDGGQALGKGITGYRERYFRAVDRLPSGVVTKWEIRPGAAERIHTLLEPLAISMGTEGRVKLPPVTYNQVRLQLPPKGRKVYDTMKNDFVVDMLDLGLGSTDVMTASTAAVLGNKLAQISSGALYVDPEEQDPLAPGRWVPLHSAKVEAVQEIVEATDSPVLVFYRFRHELERLQQALPQAQTADQPDLQRRWNAGKIPVLLAHPASAGHGLNLQHGGHTIIWASLPWSLEEYQQANKRLARQGQQHPVVIHQLLAENTVDRAVLQALDGKHSVQQALLNHLASPV